MQMILFSWFHPSFFFQKLTDIFGKSLENISLKINIKSRNIHSLKKYKYILESSVKLYDEIIERGSQYKYLGIILANDVSNSID